MCTIPFRLPELPVELQDMIFRLRLATGNTRILLLSKEINTHLVHFLYRDAYLRLHNSGVHGIPPTLPTSKISLIQNISIHIDDDVFRYTSEVPVIDLTLPLWSPMGHADRSTLASRTRT